MCCVCARAQLTAAIDHAAKGKRGATRQQAATPAEPFIPSPHAAPPANTGKRTCSLLQRAHTMRARVWTCAGDSFCVARSCRAGAQAAGAAAVTMQRYFARLDQEMLVVEEDAAAEQQQDEEERRGVAGGAVPQLSGGDALPGGGASPQPLLATSPSPSPPPALAPAKSPGQLALSNLLTRARSPTGAAAAAADQPSPLPSPRLRAAALPLQPTHTAALVARQRAEPQAKGAKPPSQAPSQLQLTAAAGKRAAAKPAAPGGASLPSLPSLAAARGPAKRAVVPSWLTLSRPGRGGEEDEEAGAAAMDLEPEVEEDVGGVEPSLRALGGRGKPLGGGLQLGSLPALSQLGAARAGGLGVGGGGLLGRPRGKRGAAALLSPLEGGGLGAASPLVMEEEEEEEEGVGLGGGSQLGQGALAEQLARVFGGDGERRQAGVRASGLSTHGAGGTRACARCGWRYDVQATKATTSCRRCRPC